MARHFNPHFSLETFMAICAHDKQSCFKFHLAHPVWVSIEMWEVGKINLP
jgi:hypothetical protein